MPLFNCNIQIRRYSCTHLELWERGCAKACCVIWAGGFPSGRFPEFFSWSLGMLAELRWLLSRRTDILLVLLTFFSRRPAELTTGSRGRVYTEKEAKRREEKEEPKKLSHYIHFTPPMVSIGSLSDAAFRCHDVTEEVINSVVRRWCFVFSSHLSLTLVVLFLSLSLCLSTAVTLPEAWWLPH